jgi:AraC-like DNA-binding protein
MVGMGRHPALMGNTSRGSIRSQIVALMAATAIELGARKAALEEALGSGLEELAGEGRRVPIDRFTAMWERATDESTRSLGIVVGARATLESYGALGYLLYTSDSAREALEHLVRAHDAINDSGVFRVLVVRDMVTLQWIRRGARTLGDRLANEMVLASCVRIAELMGVPLRCLEVRFSHSAPHDAGAHEVHFGAPIRWDAPDDAIVFEASVLDVAPIGANALLARRFEGEVQHAVDAIRREMPLPTVAARYVSSDMQKGSVSETAFARRLGISERTLRRRLASSGLRFESIAATIRCDHAEALLESGASVRETAFSVGFASVAGFVRAYRRWTGRDPSSRHDRGERRFTGS